MIPVANNVAGDRADHIQIEIGSTATDYEPYQGDTFTLDRGQTVYSGSLNWQTGLLTITDKGVAMKDLLWGKNSSVGEWAQELRHAGLAALWRMGS